MEKVIRKIGKIEGLHVCKWENGRQLFKTEREDYRIARMAMNKNSEKTSRRMIQATTTRKTEVMTKN